MHAIDNYLWTWSNSSTLDFYKFLYIICLL
jgi:hypothetical protein